MSQKSGKKTPGLEEKEKPKPEGPKDPKDLKKKAAAKAATPEKQSAASASPSKEPPAQEKKTAEAPTKADNKVENETPSKSGKPKASEKPENKESKEQDKKDTNANVQKQSASKSESPVGNGATKDNRTTEKSKMNGNSATETIEIEDDDEILLVNTDHENDELFPELSYEDNSDNENFEPSSTPEFTISNRSMTRRSQVKSVRTPETPNPGPSKGADKAETKEASVPPVNGRDEKQQSTKDGESAADAQPKDKILKMKDEHTPMKLRSSNTPTRDQKPEEEKQNEQNKDETQSGSTSSDGEESKNGHGSKKSEGGGGKIDTNFSKSRIKISPYRRSHRSAEQYSIIANYTGNNTTLETDFTLDATASTSTSSAAHQESQNNTSGLSELRGIRGRSSYRHLGEMSAKGANVVKRARLAGVVTSPAKAPTPPPVRRTPIGHVVGRKRRQTDEDRSDSSDEPSETSRIWQMQPVLKRSRLVDRVVSPFATLVTRGRSFVASSTPLPARRITPVVGVNSDMVSADIVPKPSAVNAPELKKTVTNIQVTVTPAEQISFDGNNGDKQRCAIM